MTSSTPALQVAGRGRPGNERVAAAPGRWAVWLYFLVGQAGWYACVLSAAHRVAWIGEIIALILIAIHLLRVRRPDQEFKLVATLFAIGWIWESVVRDLGLLAYPTGGPAPGLAPLWLPALWAMLAAQVNTSYNWLKSRIVIAVVFGAVAGPLAFRAGAALGALRFAKPWPAAIVLAAGWGVILPLIILLARRWDGVGAIAVAPGVDANGGSTSRVAE